MGLKNKIHPGYLHFLTTTVVDFVDIFTRPHYRHIIVDSLKYCQDSKGLELYAWCLMSNHLHLIASAKDDYSLSDILRDFKNFKFWQDGNEAKEIHTNHFLEQKLEYIHQNPVIAEIVDEPEHYLYSSARDYAGTPGLLNVILLE